MFTFSPDHPIVEYEFVDELVFEQWFRLVRETRDYAQVMILLPVSRMTSSALLDQRPR